MNEYNIIKFYKEWSDLEEMIKLELSFYEYCTLRALKINRL